MSTWGSIVTRLIDTMKTVPNVGAVHDGIRLALSEDEFYAWARVPIGDQLRTRAWLVVLEDAPLTEWYTLDGTVQWNRRAQLRGHFQLEDGADQSESGALAVAEAVCAAIDADLASTRMGGLVTFGGPCRVMRNEPRMIAFVLCHYVEIEVPLLTMEER